MPKCKALRGEPPLVWLEDYADALGTVNFLRGESAGLEEAANTVIDLAEDILAPRDLERISEALRHRAQVQEARADKIERKWERSR